MDPSRATSSTRCVVFFVASQVILIPMCIAGIANLAGFQFPKPLAFLNDHGFWILIVPAIGLFAIFRDGKWSGWKVIKSSRLMSAVFWCGWISTLVIGVVELFVDL